jgi:hypothetical protein
MEEVEEVVVDDRLIAPVGPGEALSARSVSPVEGSVQSGYAAGGEGAAQVLAK